jgi:probable F420-dependent oxidoreductase
MAEQITRQSVPVVGIWTMAFDQVPVGRLRDGVAELEELGYGLLWAPEGAGRDPFLQLGLALAATERLVGATGVANIYARDPLATATAADTLAEAYPGRVLVGLGVSHQPLVSGMRGHEYRKPLTAMREYLDGIAQAQYPAYAPEVPAGYLLGALRPKMLELARDRTLGAHPFLVSTDHTAKARELLGPDALLAPEQGVVLESDPAAARVVAREALALYLTLPNYTNALLADGFTDADLADGGSDRLVDALFAWGDEERIRQHLQRHLDAGADHVGVNVLPAAPYDTLQEAWRRLAAPLGELRR